MHDFREVKETREKKQYGYKVRAEDGTESFEDFDQYTPNARLDTSTTPAKWFVPINRVTKVINEQRLYLYAWSEKSGLTKSAGEGQDRLKMV